MNRAIALMSASALALGAFVAAAPAALAKDGDVTMRGDCSASSDWAVKVKPRKGQLRTDFWVKNAADPGQQWSYSLTRGGQTLATASRATLPNDDQGDDDTRHTAEVKFRSYVATGAGDLVFSATGPAGEGCSVTVRG